MEERGIRVGIATSRNVLGDNFNNDHEISLGGINNKGYILSGDGDDHGPLDTGEFWEYDPLNDNWTQLTSHPGGARWAPGSFVIDCDVYLTSGYEGDINAYLNDLFK